jgi:hypothetical protein
MSCLYIVSSLGTSDASRQDEADEQGEDDANKDEKGDDHDKSGEDVQQKAHDPLSADTDDLIVHRMDLLAEQVGCGCVVGW